MGKADCLRFSSKQTRIVWVCGGQEGYWKQNSPSAFKRPGTRTNNLFTTITDKDYVRGWNADFQEGKSALPTDLVGNLKPDCHIHDCDGQLSQSHFT